jgi:hypothetical protein
MLIKSTANKEDVSGSLQNTILVDLAIAAQCEEAKAILATMLGIIGQEKFDIVAEYMMCEVAYKLITDGDSPLLSAFNETLISIYSEVEAEKDLSDMVVAELRKELAQSRSENAALSATINNLKDSLARVRKHLKGEDIKPNLAVASELAKRPSLGTIERTVVELANCIKQTLISIKGA